MKVGIMSMQRVENYGSFLQAYGLKKEIEKLGHRVQFVDYQAEPSVVLSEEEQKSSSANSRISKAFHMLSPAYRAWRKKQIKMNSTFQEFSRAYNDQFLPKLDVKKEYNICPKLDVLVIGSDEVFNCTQPGNKVGFSRQLFGKNNKAKKVISYAASFGSTTYEKLEKYHIAEEVGDLLSQFDSISVRDKNSQDIVEKLCGFSPASHIDPVLLYDFPEVDDISVPMENYMVVYAYADRIKGKEAETIREFAKRENKEILSLGFYQPFCDEYVLASPLEVLAYIKHADYVITDTFHGTVFSIKYQKKFGTIIRDSNRQKLGDLMQRFDVMERQICDLEKVGEILNKEQSVEIIKAKLVKEKVKAVKYLKETQYSFSKY